MIGIIGAMFEEVEKLMEMMEGKEVLEIASMKFAKGKLQGKNVVVVQSGIGKVNAGICAQILVDRFQVKKLINTGIAGSLDARIDIGDIVISTDAVQHDMDARAFGYSLGQIPRMDALSFPADAELIEKAKNANDNANPQLHTFIGRVATGDEFVASDETKNDIKNNFNALCAEMEGAAIAQVAYLNKIPYVIIRAISDKADNSASVDYPEFEKKAILHSIRLMDKLLKDL